MDLNDIRIRLDQHTESIVSGLKNRSRFLQNNGVYTQSFAEGMTWFTWRLYHDQALDAQVGRFLFADQHPILFSCEQLSQPLVRRNPPVSEVQRVSLPDMGTRIISAYIEAMHIFCKPGEDPNTYGETAKLDAANVLEWHERICSMGMYVAETKLQTERTLRLLETASLRKALTKPDREDAVIQRAVELARRYELPRPEMIPGVFRKIIDLTLDVEIAYICARNVPLRKVS